MPALDDISGSTLANCVLSIAESSTLDDLGRAYLRAVGRLTGSPIVGFYRLDEQRPHLLYASGVPDGFTADYSAGLGRADPLLDVVLTTRRTVDGPSHFGSRNWRRSNVFELLHRWGLHRNMCAPLNLAGNVYGCVYTATRDPGCRYGASARERMDILCRAGSLALEAMAEKGKLDEGKGEGSARCIAPAVSLERLRSWLPPRAAEVAQRVCLGQSNKLIARDLGISDQTVKEHVAILCRRLHASNRTELAARLAGKKMQ